MAIAHVVGAMASNQTTTASITIPSAASAGDVAIVWFEQATNTVTASGVPAGWTQLGSDVATNSPAFARAFYKVLGGGDPGSALTVATMSGAAKWSVIIEIYSGVDGTTPIDNQSIVAV